MIFSLLSHATRLAAFAAMVAMTPAFADSMPTMPMGGTTGHHHATTTQFGAPAAASEATRIVKITMLDMGFDPSELRVRPGEIVRFVITNTSTVDHEFTLGDAATEAEHRREMSEMTAHGHGMEHDDPNAITVKAGETRELTWKFGAGGVVEYDCNIPGHYEAGMHGVITVQ